MSSNSEWEIKSLTSSDDSYQICQVPLWVSLETIDFQINWQNTSGKRPIQPNDERQYYEDLWMNNSSIMKQLIVDKVNTYRDTNDTNDTTKNIHSNEFSYLAIRNFNKGPYGIQISHYRIVRDKGCIPYAEYLLKFRTPSYEYSSWNRYSKFKFFKISRLKNPKRIACSAVWHPAVFGINQILVQSKLFKSRSIPSTFELCALRTATVRISQSLKSIDSLAS